MPPTPYQLLLDETYALILPPIFPLLVSSSLPSPTHFSCPGCECSYCHFMLYLNLLSRRHLSSVLQASTDCPFLPLAIWCSSWTSDQTPSGRDKMVANQKIHRTWVGISRCFLPSFFLPFFLFFLRWSPHCQILTFPQQDQQRSRHA